MFWVSKIQSVFRLYGEYTNEDLTKDKFCDRFKMGMCINGKLVTGTDKLDDDIINDIKMFVEDKKLRQLLMNLSINNHKSFEEYITNMNYKNNVVFSNNFELDNINEIISKLNEIYELYQIYKNTIKKLRESLLNKKSYHV